MSKGPHELVGVWDGERGLSDLRVVEREGWNGPPEDLVLILSYVAEQLRGQCIEDLQQVLERLNLSRLETKEFCLAIDGEVFSCEGCGWWCEACEESESCPGHCTDCEPDDD